MNKYKSIYLLLFFFFSFKLCFSQSENYLSDVNIQSDDASVVYNSGNIGLFETLSKKPLSIEEKAKAYDNSISQNFGLYINPFSQLVKFKTDSPIIYTNAQLTNADSGEVVYSVFDKKGIFSIDVSNIGTGVYHLILTDINKAIYSEVVSIF